jgi:hypothetical protein
MDELLDSSHRRPVTVTILAILVLLIAVTNFIRFWAAIQNWETLVAIAISPAPWYFALTGLFWGLLGCWLAWIVWQGHPGCKKAIAVLSGLYFLYFWLDRLAFQNHIPSRNTLFVAGVGILVVFYMVFTLLLPSNQEFFSRKHEQ